MSKRASRHEAPRHQARHRLDVPARVPSQRWTLGGAAVLVLITALTAAVGLAGAASDRATLTGEGAWTGHNTPHVVVPSSETPSKTSSGAKPRPQPGPRHSHHPKRHSSSSEPDPSSSSSSPSSSPSDPGDTGSCVADEKGIPQKGAYVGAAVSGTQSLPQVEQRSKESLPIHRLYFEASQVDSALSQVKSDVAERRLPWVSFKLPYSWADMAAGRGDAWAKDLVDKLSHVDGPIWLAFHHEPEGDGNMQDWKRMQQHLAPIVHAGSDNIAFSVILIAWNSFFGAADQRIDDTFPGGDDVDILGVDVYNGYGAKSHFTKSLDPMRYFGVIGPWARKHNVEWAVAETGYTAKAAAVDPDWLQTAYQDLKDEGGIALTYFNSSQHSIADWTLSDDRRKQAFDSLVERSRRVC